MVEYLNDKIEAFVKRFSDHIIIKKTNNEQIYTSYNKEVEKFDLIYKNFLDLIHMGHILFDLSDLYKDTKKR